MWFLIGLVCGMLIAASRGESKQKPNPVPRDPCPVCACENAFCDGNDWLCDRCGYRWEQDK